MEQPTPFGEKRRQIVRMSYQAGTADHGVKLIQNGFREIGAHQKKLIQIELS